MAGILDYLKPFWQQGTSPSFNPNSQTPETSTGLLNNLPNIFMSPDYASAGILDADTQKKLEQSATKRGLTLGLVDFLTTPRTMKAGSILPYIGKAYGTGMSAASDIFEKGVAQDYRQQILGNKGFFGQSLEGSAFNILSKGSGDSEEAKQIRGTPEYALAWRKVNEPKYTSQIVTDEFGNQKFVPVQIPQQKLPESIKPPLSFINGETVELNEQNLNQPITATTNNQINAELNQSQSNLIKSGLTLQPTEAKEYKDQIKQVELLDKTLNALEADINTNGMQLFALGGKGGYQKQLYEDALTQIRLMAELGVLNKEDLPRIQAQLPDPSAFSTWLAGGGSPSKMLGAMRGLRTTGKIRADLAKEKLGIKEASKELSAEELQAYEWANANPDDPRSKQILQQLGK